MSALNIVIPYGSIVYTPEQQVAYKKRKELEKTLYLKRGCSDPLGYFYFARTDESFSSISAISATRLIYLNTYMDFEGRLMLTERTPIKRANLHEILGVSVATANRFLQEVTPMYLEEKLNGDIVVNSDIFKRGALSPKAESHKKIYIKGVRKLYKSLPRRQDKYLGFLFKLLPHINIEYNLICRNPWETDKDKIELISLAEFCCMIGYDVRHVSNLLKIYSEILFDVGGHKERFCAIAYDGVHKEGAKIIINPHILYSGSNYSKIEVLGLFCTD